MLRINLKDSNIGYPVFRGVLKYKVCTIRIKETH